MLDYNYGYTVRYLEELRWSRGSSSSSAVDQYIVEGGRFVCHLGVIIPGVLN